jgi:hypothetical protein
MKYTIEQERLMKVMIKFFNDMLPDFQLPLKQKIDWRKGNSGYGSGLDDYMSATTNYIDEDGRVWFIEYGNREKGYSASDSKWDVNERLMPLYEYFGEESFELFIKWLFKLDLKDMGEFSHDYTFTDMDWVITESEPSRYVVDDIPDDKLVKIINRLVKHIYGRELNMVRSDSGYLRFYSIGPVAPYQRNLSGRLWVDDDRLEKTIEGLFGIDSEQAAALIAFYFSEKYNIEVTDARPPLSMGWYERVIDYDKFDNPKYVVPDED